MATLRALGDVSLRRLAIGHKNTLTWQPIPSGKLTAGTPPNKKRFWKMMIFPFKGGDVQVELAGSQSTGETKLI